MTEVSKHVFEKACSDLECHYIMHPWHESCWKQNFTTTKAAFVGSCKFYSIVYLAQLAMRGKKMLRGKEEWYKMGEYYARSTIYGCLVSGSAAPLGCLLRKLMGNKFGYYTYLLIPNMINGLFIYMEPPSRRGLVINLFCNLMIEYWLRTLEKAGHIVMTKSKQTFLFMIGSAALFYLMRLEGDKEKRTPLFWTPYQKGAQRDPIIKPPLSVFLSLGVCVSISGLYLMNGYRLFTPEKVKIKTEHSEIPCPHKGACYKHILKGFLKLFGTGLAISLSRVMLPKLANPVKAISAIRGKHFRMAMFFGSYIGIYRAIICLLCRKRGYDSALFALPAGYFAGMSFFLNPNLGFSIASLSAAFKLYSTILYKKKLLPDNIPLPELMYCVCQGTLFHARFMHPDVCPKYIFNLMNSGSNGCTESLYANMSEAVKRVI